MSATTLAADDVANATRRRRLLSAVWLVPLLAYAAFVLLGLTTSSIGVSPYLRADPTHRLGVEIGSPQPYRSDEWETESAITLGQMAIGGSTLDNRLSVSPNYFSQLPSGPVSAVVFFDGTLLRLGPVLPDQMLFAMRWWLPALLLVIFTPIWFHKVTKSWLWGYLATAMILLAPSSMWWSMRPVNTLGFMFAGAALTVIAHERWTAGRRITPVVLVAVAAVLFARFPSYYQPLAIIVGFPVVVATAAFILRSGRRVGATLGFLLSVALASAVVTVGTALESLSAIETGINTVYPGNRVTTGEANPLGKVFGATTMGWLGSMNSQAPVTNSTEVSSAFTVLLPVLVVLLVLNGRRWYGSRAHLWAFVAATFFAVLWVAWCTVDWGRLGTLVPLMNRVPSYRGANASGFPVAIAFCLFMSQWRRPKTVAVAVVCGAVAGLVTAAAGWDLSITLLPDLSRRMILIAAAATAVVVTAMVSRPRSVLVAAVAILAMASLTYRVNPIELGLADLRDSTPARFLTQEGIEARARGELWASDDRWVDALVTATGTPSLSGRQQIGPVDEEWQRLDPDNTHRGLWNRGGTHIEFTWSASSDIEWRQDFLDVVQMRVSPCRLAEIFPSFTHVISTTALSASCLSPLTTFPWAGQTRYAYTVSIHR